VLAELDPAERIPLEPGAAAGSNVLVITMDTTRADHLSCYGNAGIQTPVIDGLARRGVLFANAFTASPSTLPGHSSIHTGLYPYHHGARANGTFQLGSENTTLAEILRSNGYTTAAFISAYVLDGRFGLEQGFDLYDDDLSKGIKYSEHSFRERPAQYTNEAVLEWLGTVERNKFFAWVHYFDPHAPYVPPEPFRTKYADRPYDGEIAYTDAEIGELLAGLAKLGVLDNTLIVLAGDHGEGLGEHGESTHSLLVYDSTLHTPLIFCPPGTDSLGLVVNRQVSNVDIVPTILALLGIEADARFDGVSLLQGPAAHPQAIYAETISTLVLHGWSPLFTVRMQDSKYIHAPRPELYDLKDDPKELKNLFDQRPEQVAALARELETHVGGDVFGGQALTQMVTMDRETARRLAALGYVGTKAGEIDVQSAAQFDPKDMVPHFERVQAASNLMAAGQFRQAVAEMEACLEIVPNDVWTLRLLTSAYVEKGDLDRAEQMAMRSLELEKHEPSIYLSLGRIALSRGRVAEAERHYRRALELDPQFAPAYVALGTLQARVGDTAAALEHFHQAIEMDPGMSGPMAYNAMGGMYLGRMELEQAREAFNKTLEIDKLNGGARSGLATILIEENKLEQAEAELETAAHFLPNDVRVLATLAALHNKRQDYDQGVELARRALEVNENNTQALNGLGSALRGQGDLAGAREAFEKILDKNPTYVPALINLAQVELNQRHEEKAAELYQRALRINPAQPLALFNLGTYKVSVGRREEAIGLYQRAVKVDPDYAIAHLHLGMLLLQVGRPAEAIPHLKRSLELEPDLPEAGRVRSIIDGYQAASSATTRPQDREPGGP
jgi:arylsulfatase A-like enzyme/Tfp pilus assembly protein PilF